MSDTYAWLPEWVDETDALPRDAHAPLYFDSRFDRFLAALEEAEIRAASKGEDGVWRAVSWVKRGILLGFRFGRLVEMSTGTPRFERASRVGTASGPDASPQYFDKHTYPTQRFLATDNVRIVPGGSAIRRGAYIAAGVVCMPPMYINVGAHVGTGTMVDSHALVGSCAQIGMRVHLSAAAQIGGVLEPVNATPVIIEDDVIVGGNCGVYEGTVVRSGAVLAAGVVLTRGTPVYDLVTEKVHRAAPDATLEIPSRAVVVPGARIVRGAWGVERGLSLQTPVIVKYRDEKTDLATALEGWLR
ncbi:MAG TPA: 2,3,4,5-tetrahydropyridine-2,6-dicarboxylate N-succinyltransferase [Gemmatimonadaceae bacterium]|nr:2,3,4,5-tetrahydropyridine-2,6-dicarboxylate N-succinyltransferase [Gemmatimonadaceae bacterium]